MYFRAFLTRMAENPPPRSASKMATTVIEVDSEIPANVTSALYSLDAVKNVIIVPRIKMD